MCNKLLRSFVMAAVCCTVLGLAVPTYAQRGFGFRIQFGREARAVGLIHSAENRSDRFAATLSGREDFLAEQARDLANQLNRVRSDADQGSSFYDIRAQVANAVTVARGINREMRERGRMDWEVERQWSMLRSDLNGLARAYNLSGIG